MDVVWIAAVGALPAGTLGELAAPIAPGEVPDTVSVRVGREVVAAPASAVVVRSGPVRRGDVDGDGRPDRVWRAEGAWIDEAWDGMPTRAAVVVAELATGVVTGPLHAAPCTTEGYEGLAVRDVTGDGRPEVLAVVRTSTCEVGWTADTLEILAPRGGVLDPLLVVDATAWPLVGPITAGEVAVRPGVVERVTVAGADDGGGPLVRTVDRYTWDGAAFVGPATTSGPVRALVDGRAIDVVEVRPFEGAVGPDGAVIPLDAVRFLDRPLDDDLHERTSSALRVHLP